MRVLAIETASEACSVALFEGTKQVARDHREIGRGHAEQLVPMIAGLPDKGKSDRIMVSLGPGSFTGVRIGIATARALGAVWQSEVLGYPTLALVAAMAQERQQKPVTVCTNGGHGEWFVQDFDIDGEPTSDLASLSPESARKRSNHALIAGSKAEELASTDPANYLRSFSILPDSGKVPLIPATLHSRSLGPIYGRAPDATPQQSFPSKLLKNRLNSA